MPCLRGVASKEWGAIWIRRVVGRPVAFVNEYDRLTRNEDWAKAAPSRYLAGVGKPKQRYKPIDAPILPWYGEFTAPPDAAAVRYGTTLRPSRVKEVMLMDCSSSRMGVTTEAPTA